MWRLGEGEGRGNGWVKIVTIINEHNRDRNGGQKTVTAAGRTALENRQRRTLKVTTRTRIVRWEQPVCVNEEMKKLELEVGEITASNISR